VQIVLAHVDLKDVHGDFSTDVLSRYDHPDKCRLTAKVAYDTVRSLGIAELGSVIDLSDGLEAHGFLGCVRPAGERLRRVPLRTYLPLREMLEPAPVSALRGPIMYCANIAR
jgi:hypothetical protein